VSRLRALEPWRAVSGQLTTGVGLTRRRAVKEPKREADREPDGSTRDGSGSPRRPAARPQPDAHLDAVGGRGRSGIWSGYQRSEKSSFWCGFVAGVAATLIVGAIVWAAFFSRWRIR
jgi:hypothetical protein